MAGARTSGSPASAVASRVWLVVQISSAVTFALSVEVNWAWSCCSMVRRSSWFPHQPNSATNPAMTSGSIQIGCLKRLVMVAATKETFARTARFRQHQCKILPRGILRSGCRNCASPALRGSRFRRQLAGKFHSDEANIVVEFVVHGKGADGLDQFVEQLPVGFGQQVLHVHHH